jgi:hypothetical protein
MPRGGLQNPKGGRPAGSRNTTSKQLEQWMSTAGAGSVIERLTALVEDPRTPTPIALESLRRLFAWYMRRAELDRGLVQPSEAPTDG